MSKFLCVREHLSQKATSTAAEEPVSRVRRNRYDGGGLSAHASAWSRAAAAAAWQQASSQPSSNRASSQSVASARVGSYGATARSNCRLQASARESGPILQGPPRHLFPPPLSFLVCGQCASALFQPPPPPPPPPPPLLFNPGLVVVSLSASSPPPPPPPPPDRQQSIAAPEPPPVASEMVSPEAAPQQVPLPVLPPPQVDSATLCAVSGRGCDLDAAGLAALDEAAFVPTRWVGGTRFGLWSKVVQTSQRGGAKGSKPLRPWEKNR